MEPDACLEQTVSVCAMCTQLSEFTEGELGVHHTASHPLLLTPQKLTLTLSYINLGRRSRPTDLIRAWCLLVTVVKLILLIEIV